MSPARHLLLALGLLVGGPAALAQSPPVSPTRVTLPGAEPMPAELEARLGRVLDGMAADYVPRTRHLLPGGAPQYTNRLLLESSPYLRQHAHNPVNWFAWGEEAFAEARGLGRPILLSIGYSTCHWCHVMEEESFEDLEIATFMNAHYVAIKVDREERPDLDGIYMSAVRQLGSRGGWPMTTWLNAEGEPFYGGTYFPPRDGARRGRPGFLTLLRRMHEVYTTQPEQTAAVAKRVAAGIVRAMRPSAADALPGDSVLAAALSAYKSRFDAEYGGVLGRPKFPSSLPIRFLLRRYRSRADAKALEMATFTLTKMAEGGMYDQLGGGFHRYSTDVFWLVPHFEKMLYDNALLAVAYLEGHQATGREDFARTTREILRYVLREMTAPEGGFYSATDADSTGPDGKREEGLFFTWTPQEIHAALGADEARLFGERYGVRPGGQYEGRNVLHVARPLEALAAGRESDVREIGARLERSRETLFRKRQDRPPPLRDEKILTAWNGLMISALARAGFALEEPDFVEGAARAAAFFLADLGEDGRLRRSHIAGRARHNAYLEDYAFLIQGLLDLYESTWNPRWLGEAAKLQAVQDAHYSDPRGGYFLTPEDHEPLLAREKPDYDGAEPCGNSVALMNLLRLHELTTRAGYRIAAEKLLGAFARTLRDSPSQLSEMLSGLEFYLANPKEVMIVTPAGGEGAGPLLSVLRRSFLPNKVFAVAEQGPDLERQAAQVVLLEGKVARGGKTTAYVCQAGVCQLPTGDPETFRAQLESEPTTPTSPNP